MQPVLFPKFDDLCQQGVYLIHFEKKVSDKHTCQHYIGYADNIARRFADHVSGNGARLTQVAGERGIPFRVVAIWPGQDRNFERRLHNRKGSPKMCPICKCVHKEEAAPDFTLDDVPALEF